MERYDGKTKKDDYKKYALIALVLVAVIVVYFVITLVIKKASHPTPDMTVVLTCERALDFQNEDLLEKKLSAWIPDLDGNGKSVVDVIGIRLVDNEAVTANGLDTVGAATDIQKLREYMQDGTYAVFLLSDGKGERAVQRYGNQEYCLELPEDLADAENPYLAEVTGSAWFSESGWGHIPFYGCVQKDATAEEYEVAVELLRQLKADQ